MKCTVVNCKNSNDGKASTCSFFQFPADSTIRKKWISFCGHKNFNPDTSFVCMHHFKAEDFLNTMQYEMGFAKKRLLKNGVVPTINVALTKTDDQRAQRNERRENKKTVNFLLNNYESEETNILQSIENIATTTEYVENMEIADIQNPNEENLTLDVTGSHNLSLKVETLENEILILRKEKEINDAVLKSMKERMAKMEKIHANEKEEMEKCIAKAKYDLKCIEEKLKVFFTEGQIKKLKSNKRQTWSEDDIAHSITLYAVSPRMYKFMYKNKFPLPAVRTLQSKLYKNK